MMTKNTQPLQSPCPTRIGLPLWLAGLILAGAAGCTPFDFIFGPIPPDDPSPNTDLDLGIALVRPANNQVQATIGAPAQIRWADIAAQPGTVVRVFAQRQDIVSENPGPAIHLVGDGTNGSGRDAIADGDNDLFDWDVTGVRAGDYIITAVIESPSGESITIVSRDADLGTNGFVRVTTALPVPTLTFTAPGAADETLTTGNSFIITWTDNGAANADALLILGLDTDDDHTSGNEFLLIDREPLGDDGNMGSFTFSFTDVNGDTVPDGTYTVFAILDDNANDIVTVEAGGQLLLNP